MLEQNGIIYAINQSNDLLWYRHDGRNDGSFQWLDNNARKVGVGWDVKHIFYGGDGVIYAINQSNDLLWYRHDGRNDGSFQWLDNNARKVGVGWDVKHIFYGGDGFSQPDLPSAVTLDSGAITSGLSIGGSAKLVMARDGQFTFSGHMHDGGALGIDFLLTLVAMSPSGIAYTVQHVGHTAGTFTPGSRNDDWVIPGFNEGIRNNWSEASKARLSWTLHANDTLTPQLGKALEEALQEALKQAGQAAVKAAIALL